MTQAAKRTSMALAALLFFVFCVNGCSLLPWRWNRHTQKGVACWYGKKYEGRKTASGERFDPKAYTAAHRKLPFGTVVRVKNLANGRTVKVRINDRGPFVRGRIIDLSEAAARELNMLRTGTARVRIEVLRWGGR